VSGFTPLGVIPAVQTALDLKADTSAVPELARDAIGTALVAGLGITSTVDDGGDMITISRSGGTSFPVPPVSGDHFIRTDRQGMEYRYDGTRWLSVQKFAVALHDTRGGVNPRTATGGFMEGVNPEYGAHSVLIEAAVTWYFLQTAGEWTLAITAEGGELAITTQAFAFGAGHRGLRTTPLSVVVADTYPLFVATPTETVDGGSFYFQTTLIYRLIG
jgi:hypothetical protein